MRPTTEAQTKLEDACAGYAAFLATLGLTIPKPLLAMLREGWHLSPEETRLAARFYEWLRTERYLRGPMTVREAVAHGLRMKVPRAVVAAALLMSRASRHQDVFGDRLPGERLPHDLGFGLITEREAARWRPARAARGLLRDGESL